GTYIDIYTFFHHLERKMYKVLIKLTGARVEDQAAILAAFSCSTKGVGLLNKKR
ncbi:MAG: hypothetical protein K0S80_1855, partial [Neobacillus sp.]|nr:hypothetical protein [Neobacillus sp.]